MYHDDATGLTPLWPRVEAEATCYRGHPAPSPGCRCGIYGAVAGTLDSLPGYLRNTSCDRDPWAYAEIACHGRVFVDMRGVRVERARLMRIALPGSGWPGQAARDETRMLRDCYGVPVGGLEYVPQWLTANVRPGGPPPDSENPQPRSHAPGPVLRVTLEQDRLTNGGSVSASLTQGSHGSPDRG